MEVLHCNATSLTCAPPSSVAYDLHISVAYRRLTCSACLLVSTSSARLLVCSSARLELVEVARTITARVLLGLVVVGHI